jgi:hypothetical protein
MRLTTTLPLPEGKLARLGVEPMPMNLDEFAKSFREDVEAAVKLVKAAKIPTQ